MKLLEAGRHAPLPSKRSCAASPLWRPAGVLVLGGLVPDRQHPEFCNYRRGPPSPPALPIFAEKKWFAMQNAQFA